MYYLHYSLGRAVAAAVITRTVAPHPTYPAVRIRIKGGRSIIRYSTCISDQCRSSYAISTLLLMQLRRVCVYGCCELNVVPLHWPVACSTQFQADRREKNSVEAILAASCQLYIYAVVQIHTYTTPHVYDDLASTNQAGEYPIKQQGQVLHQDITVIN